MLSETNRYMPPLYRVCLVHPSGMFYEYGYNFMFMTEDAQEAKAAFENPQPLPSISSSKPHWPGPVARVCGLTWDYEEARWVQRKFRDARPGEFGEAPVVAPAPQAFSPPF